MSRDRLYREAGEALHLAQVLEFNISTLIKLLNEYGKANIDGIPLIVGDDKRTLGQLIVALKKHVSIDAAGLEALTNALNERNYLAHEFFIRNVDAFQGEFSSARASKDIKERAKIIAIGTAITSSFVQGLCKALNIPMSAVQVRQDT